MTILDEIFVHKRAELKRQKALLPLAIVMNGVRQAPDPLDFLGALRSQARARPHLPSLIAEVKRASPSRGMLVPGLDPVEMARIYKENGAAAISVLTEERFFLGSLDDLRRVAQAGLDLPVLRKDFICDPYQVYEARLAGADAVLLIVACLDPALLCELHMMILELGMTPLVEVHDRQELEIAMVCDPVLIGVNNRDLDDFSVNLETTTHLRPYVPDEICLVAESGIHTGEDVESLARVGVDAILVGEALVTAGNIAAKVRSLVYGQG